VSAPLILRARAKAMAYIRQVWGKAVAHRRLEPRSAHFPTNAAVRSNPDRNNMCCHPEQQVGWLRSPDLQLSLLT
jgi:hypothetical protein